MHWRSHRPLIRWLTACLARPFPLRVCRLICSWRAASSVARDADGIACVHNALKCPLEVAFVASVNGTPDLLDPCVRRRCRVVPGPDAAVPPDYQGAYSVYRVDEQR